MLELEQQPLFDWNALDTDTRLFVQEKTQAIHARLKRTAEDIIAIGEDLIAVNERLAPYGKFHAWLRAEFGMTRSMAYNFMNVATRFGGDCPKFGQLQISISISVLYELAAPSTPDTIVEQVQSGEIPASIPAIREAKREYQQQPPTLSEHEAALAGYRGYEKWQEAHKWNDKLRELQEDKPDTEPSIPAYIPTPIPAPAPMPSSFYSTYADEDEDEEEEETEEDRYQTAVDMGTLEYYHDGLVRDAIQRDREEREVRRGGVPAALQMSESNEWYTPAIYVDAARELMGDIDVDPASNAYANEKVVHATTYYDILTNGLDKDWTGRVWMNPPYGREGGDSNQEIWTRRLVEQFDAGITTEAVILVNAVTDRKWFQPLWRFPICFTNHRIRFYNTEIEAGQPTHGNALIYLGPQVERFIDIFEQFGPVVRRVRWQQQ
jgi:hypothetical protein